MSRENERRGCNMVERTTERTGGPKPDEIRITRVYDAPVQTVWDAWTIPSQVERWWGPRGFTLTTHSKDLQPGGTWRYTMHGPDGTDYPNVARYYVVEPCAKLVYDHGGTDDTPPLFRVTVTFHEHAGKTTMEMVSTLPTEEAARQIGSFIKKVGGTSTWDRLAEYLDQTGEHASFVFVRLLECDLARALTVLEEQLPGTLGDQARVVEREPFSRISVTHPLHPEERAEAAASTISFAQESNGVRVQVVSRPTTAQGEARLGAARNELTRRWNATFDRIDAQLGS
jgi:uncharacterized protein YndB with AHSA1/START domain